MEGSNSNSSDGIGVSIAFRNVWCYRFPQYNHYTILKAVVTIATGVVVVYLIAFLSIGVILGFNERGASARQLNDILRWKAQTATAVAASE